MNTRTRKTTNHPILIARRLSLIYWTIALLCVTLAACMPGTTSTHKNSQPAPTIPVDTQGIQPAAPADGKILPPECGSQPICDYIKMHNSGGAVNSTEHTPLILQNCEVQGICGYIKAHILAEGGRVIDLTDR